jgi:hypothetical protein
MSEDQQNFLRFAEAVCQRPGMYLGRRCDFYTLTVLLEGYAEGFEQGSKTQFHPFARLLPVLEHAHGFSHPSWSWRRHYMHDKRTEERAIKDFPRFLKEALEVPDSQIQAWHKARVQSQPPRSPHTARSDW